MYDGGSKRMFPALFRLLTGFFSLTPLRAEQAFSSLPCRHYKDIGELPSRSSFQGCIALPCLPATLSVSGPPVPARHPRLRASEQVGIQL